MKITVFFETDRDLKGINTIYPVQGWLYQNLETVDSSLAKWLHDEGIRVDKVVVKPVNFSPLFKVKSKKGVYGIKVSTPHDKVFYALIRAVMKPKELTLKTEEDLILLKPIDVDVKSYKGQNRFFTLSPMLLRQKDENNILRFVKLDFSNPEDIETAREIIERNLTYKYIAIHGSKPEKGISFIPKKMKTDFYTCYNLPDSPAYVAGYTGEFELHGDYRMLEIAYYTGIGGKNACGFGCIEASNGSK